MNYRWSEDRITCGGIQARRIVPESPRGLIIWYHGWSSAADGQLTRARIWAAAQWEVIVPDVPRHDDRGVIDYDAVESYPLFWETILDQIEESPLWIDYAASRGYRSIVTAGHSMGGCTALGVAAKTPAVCAVIAMNGSGHWPLTHLFMQARFGMSYRLADDLAARMEAVSPHAHIAAMTSQRIHLLHGVHDTTVDARADQVFADRLKAQGGTVIWQSVRDVGHAVTTGMMDDAVAALSKHKD